MDKSIHSREYNVFLDLLRRTRQQNGLTQLDVANALGVTQSIVSKCERGERRMDVVEVRSWCNALGVSIQEFIDSFDEACGSGQVSRE